MFINHGDQPAEFEDLSGLPGDYSPAIFGKLACQRPLDVNLVPLALPYATDPCSLGGNHTVDQEQTGHEHLSPAGRDRRFS